MTRPLKLGVGEATASVSDAKSVKGFLQAALGSVATDIIAGSPLYNNNDQNLNGQFCLYIPSTSISNGDRVVANITFDGYSGNVVGALSYLQTLIWIRNFNYGSKLERQKISKNRVSTFISQDTRQLKKLIYTFGGEPMRFLEKGNK